MASICDFVDQCASNVHALKREIHDLQQEVEDELSTDDLIILSDSQLVEAAMQDSDGRCDDEPNLETANDVQTPQEQASSKNKNTRKRKSGLLPPGQKRIRRSDCEIREQELQLDPTRVKFFQNRKFDLDKCKELAYSQLHSLQFLKSEEPKPRIPQTTNLLKEPMVACPSKFQSPAPLPDSEVLLTIAFYTGRRKSQEVVVLGRHFLTVLRDVRLNCNTESLAEAAGWRSCSGFVLINNVFYNDYRDPEAVDYSEPIIRWVTKNDAHKRKGRRRELRVASMGDTCFLDLKDLRVGARCLYVHHGCCKHEFVVTDIRLIHPDDPQDAGNYPVIKFLPLQRQRRKCSICDIFRATKVTYDDDLAPSSPCYFCEECYSLLHFDKNGVPLPAGKCTTEVAL